MQLYTIEISTIREITIYGEEEIILSRSNEVVRSRINGLPGSAVATYQRTMPGCVAVISDEIVGTSGERSTFRYEKGERHRVASPKTHERRHEDGFAAAINEAMKEHTR